jgi:hypothetical protein
MRATDVNMRLAAAQVEAQTEAVKQRYAALAAKLKEELAKPAPKP